MQEAAPGFEYLEISQRTHSVLSPLEREPPAQRLQEEAAGDEEEPASHAEQDAAPPVVYVPASQSTQSVLSVLEYY